jgi:hypothetical protein
MIFEILAALCAGLFAGAAMYISCVEHPARLQGGTAAAVAAFGPCYRRAAVMQASLAVAGFLAALIAWWQGRGLQILVGGVLLGTVVPFTLLVVEPTTNRRLLDPALDRSSGEAGALLRRWGRLHAVRSVVSGVGFVLLLARLARPG